jgi:hypothetical protein
MQVFNSKKKKIINNFETFLLLRRLRINFDKKRIINVELNSTGLSSIIS